MPGRRSAAEVKKRVGDRLLAVPGVAGVGVPGGRLTVYLEVDAAEARRACQEIVRNEGSGCALAFVVTGRFQPQ